MVRHVAPSLKHFLYPRDDQDSCPSEFVTNGKSPCNVGQTLLEPCSVQQIDSLLIPPGANWNTSCNCNTVVYNLASACAICGQSNETEAVERLPPFSNWTTNCTMSLVEYTTYPVTNSSNLSEIPKWAYNNITSDGRFDARAVLDANKGWSAVQILVPVIIGLALLIAFAAFWLWRIRRRKRQREMPVPTGIATPSWWCCARPRRVRHRRHVKGEWSVDADDEPDAFALQNAPPSRVSASPAASDRPRRRERRLPRRVGTLVQHAQELLGRPVAVLERKGSQRGEYDIAADEDELRAAMAMVMALEKPLPQSPEPAAPKSNSSGGVSMGVLGFLSRLGLSNATSSSGGGGSYAGVEAEDEDDDRIEVDIHVPGDRDARRHRDGRDNSVTGPSQLGPASSATSHRIQPDDRATTDRNGQPPSSPSFFSRMATVATSGIAGPSQNRSVRSLADQGAKPGSNAGAPAFPPLPAEADLDEHRTIEEAMSIGDHSPATSYDPAPLPWAVKVNTSVPMLGGLGTGESGFLVPMDSPASGAVRQENGSVVLISKSGRDFSLGPSSEGAGGASTSGCDSGARSVRTNTTNTRTSSRDRQSLAVYPPTPFGDAHRFSSLGSPSAREPAPPAMLLPPALGGPPSAWVRGANGRLVPRRVRPRTTSGNSSLNGSRTQSDDDSIGAPSVPSLPNGALQSRSATTSSSLRVEPQTPQTATESSGSHSHNHASGSSVVGNPPTPGQSPIASPHRLDGSRRPSDTEFYDYGGILPVISPLPSTITALFDSFQTDEGEPHYSRPQPLALSSSHSSFLDREAIASPPSLSASMQSSHASPSLSGKPGLAPISEAPVSPLSDIPPTATTSLFTKNSQIPAPPNTSLPTLPLSPLSQHAPVSQGTSTTITSKSRISGTSGSVFTNESLLLAPPNTAAAPSPEVGQYLSGRSAPDNAELEPEWRTDVAIYDPPSAKSNQASFHRDPSPSSFSLQTSPAVQKPYNNESKTSLPHSPPPPSKHSTHSPSSSLSSLHSPERPSGPRAYTHPGSNSPRTSIHGRAVSASQVSLPRPPDSLAPPLHTRSISASYLSPSPPVYPPGSYDSPPMATRSPYTPSQRSATVSNTSLYSPRAASPGLAYSPALSSISLSSRPLPIPGRSSTASLPPGSPARQSGEGLGTRPLPPGPAISRVPSGSRGTHAVYGQFGQRYSTVAEEQ